MITEKDRLILRHVGTHGYITINQASIVAYPTMKRNYEYARVRLLRLCDIEKRLKIIRNTASRLNLFVDINADANEINNMVTELILKEE